MNVPSSKRFPQSCSGVQIFIFTSVSALELCNNGQYFLLLVSFREGTKKVFRCWQVSPSSVSLFRKCTLAPGSGDNSFQMRGEAGRARALRGQMVLKLLAQLLPNSWGVSMENFPVWDLLVEFIISRIPNFFSSKFLPSPLMPPLFLSSHVLRFESLGQQEKLEIMQFILNKCK